MTYLCILINSHIYSRHLSYDPSNKPIIDEFSLFTLFSIGPKIQERMKGEAIAIAIRSLKHILKRECRGRPLKQGLLGLTLNLESTCSTPTIPTFKVNNV